MNSSSFGSRTSAGFSSNRTIALSELYVSCEIIASLHLKITPFNSVLIASQSGDEI
jgi:hypothetical protein